MTFEIDTLNLPMELHLTINAARPCIINIKGKEGDNRKNVYFSRSYGFRNDDSKLVHGTKKFVIPMPLTPKSLIIDIKNDIGYDNVQLVDIKAHPLAKKSDLWLDATDREFIDFIFKFAPALHAVDDNDIWASTSEKFIIRCLPVIQNRETKEILNTPARINRLTGIIEINNNKLKSYTVFMRIVILFHEYFHWKLNTKIEQEADYNALNWFLSLGFPQTEAMYAFTRVFPKDSKGLKQRELDNINFIKNFHAQSAR